MTVKQYPPYIAELIWISTYTSCRRPDNFNPTKFLETKPRNYLKSITAGEEIKFSPKGIHSISTISRPGPMIRES